MKLIPKSQILIPLYYFGMILNDSLKYKEHSNVTEGTIFTAVQRRQKTINHALVLFYI